MGQWGAVDFPRHSAASISHLRTWNWFLALVSDDGTGGTVSDMPMVVLDGALRSMAGRPGTTVHV